MAVNNILRIIFSAVLLVALLLLARNIFLLRQAKIELSEMSLMVTSLSVSFVSEETLVDELETIRYSRSLEEARYHIAPEDAFYEFAEFLTDRAVEAGLTIEKATASGQGPEKTWELEIQGPGSSVLGLLEELDREDMYYRYPTLSLKQVPNGKLEAYLAIQLPDLPDIEKTDELSDTPDVPVIVPRISADRLAAWFGMSSIQPPAYRSPTPGIPQETPTPASPERPEPRIVVIGYYSDIDGTVVLALKDIETTLVRRLRPNKEVSGWTLISIDEETAVLQIKEQTITISLEHE